MAEKHRAQHKKGEVVFRSATIETPAIDVDARTASLAFATETPVTRWDWVEVLDMAGMNTERLATGRAALLMEHNRSDQVGVVQSVSLGDDNVWRAVVRFSRSPRGEEIFQDVIDGIRSLVSVGYTIDEIVLDKQENGESTYRVTKWTPHEISVVSIPADTQAGFGRAIETPQQPETPAAAPKVEPSTVPATPSTRSTQERNMDEETKALISKAQAESNKRASAILQLGAKHKMDVAAREFVASGKSLEEFRAHVLDNLKTAQPTSTRGKPVGMNDKEVKQYSFLRLLDAARSGDWSKAGLEREAHNAALSVRNTARGILVPADVLMGRASDQKVTPQADGGYLVATDLRTDNFIDALRARLVTGLLGARVFSDLVGDQAFPKETGLNAVAWVAEDGAAANTKTTFGQVLLKPRTVLGKTSISRKLMVQSSIDVEAFVRDRFQKIVALALDHAALVGGGANEPAGVISQLGAGQKIDIDLVGGATPTWANVVGLETRVAMANADNVDVSNMGYIANASMRGAMKVAPKVAGTAQFIWEDDGPGRGMVNGYQSHCTNLLPSTAPVLFGNFADLFIGLWSGLDIVVDQISDDSGAHIVKVFQDADVGIGHVESFAAIV